MAIKEFKAGKAFKAIEMNPRLALETDAWREINLTAVFRYSEGLNLARTHKYHDALVKYHDAIHEDPKAMWAKNNLANLLSTCRELYIRDGRGAVKYAIDACEDSQWTVWGFVDTLGNVLAEAGEFDMAIQCYELAKRLAIGFHKSGFAENEMVWQLNVERAKRMQVTS